MSPSPTSTPVRSVRRSAAIAWALSALLLVAGVAWLLDLADRPRVFNWDLVAYVGLLHELDVASEGLASEGPAAGDPRAEVHRRTYASLADELPANAVDRLTAHPRYRGHRAWEWGREVSRDPEAFAAALDFYRSRLGFTALVALVRQCGVPPVRSVRVASLVGYAALVALLFAWIGNLCHDRRRPWLGPLAGLVAALAIGASAPLADVARLWTPDLVAAFFLLAGLWALITRRGSAASLVLLLAAILVRPDHALVAACVLFAAALAPGLVPRTRREVLAGAALGFPVLAAALGRATGHPGWSRLFHFTFVQEEVALGDATIGPAEYLGAWSALAHRFGESTTLLFVVLGLLLFVAGVRGARRRTLPRTYAAVLAALLVAFAARFVLFPALWDRLWIPFDLFVLVACIAALRGGAASEVDAT